MQIRFYLDPVTGFPHIHNHGIDESEVEDIVETREYVMRGRDGTRLALGQTSAGRYLKVVYREEPGSIFVITAVELRGKALRAFRRLRRKKHGKR